MGVCQKWVPPLLILPPPFPPPNASVLVQDDLVVHYQTYHEEVVLTEVDVGQDLEYFANLQPQEPTLDSLTSLAEEFACNAIFPWKEQCSQVLAFCGSTGWNGSTVQASEVSNFPDTSGYLISPPFFHRIFGY